jgi:hypothetical protein
LNIFIIQKFVADVRTYRERAHAVLDACPNEPGTSVVLTECIEKLQTTYVDGAGFDLQLDETTQLRDRIELYKWYTRADAVLHFHTHDDDAVDGDDTAKGANSHLAYGG